MNADSRKPIRLFVSHISEESRIAALLTRMMEDDFLGLVNFFTSSDLGSIDLGTDWLSAVGQAMNEAAAVIVLCSKASVQRPWVQFEVGAAWMKGLPIIPVCHSGMGLDELKMPLIQRHGIELGTPGNLERLYLKMAKLLKLGQPPQLSNMPERLRRIRELEQHFRSLVQQFELFINVVIPYPGQLEDEIIPDGALIQSDDASLQLFGFTAGQTWTWRDIVRAAEKRTDRRWLTQLQKCIALASRNQRFDPVQAVYHTGDRSYQPQLSKKEIAPNGDCVFHVHFVDTVVAPLSDVQNEFGVLATLLRLGLRFRYEVIERFRRLESVRDSIGSLQAPDEVLRHLQQLRSAIDIIEMDATSRGAENFGPETVASLFENGDDQDEIARLYVEWRVARKQLFDTEPTAQELGEIIKRMRQLNFRFMKLGARRFHEMVGSDWGGAESGDAPPLVRAA